MSSKLKVLALIPDFIEKPSGGMGEQFRYLHQYLSDKVDYYICGYPEKNNIKNYRNVFTPMPGIEHVALITASGQLNYFYEGLKHNIKPDIIHGFDWSTYVAAVHLAWYYDVPLVNTMQLSVEQLNQVGIAFCHDIKTVDGHHINKMQVIFEHFGLHYANKVIQVSNAYSNYYSQYKDKTIVIHNGIDTKKWVKTEDYKLPGKNKTKICYIGRASLMKGMRALLETSIPKDVDFYFIVSPKNAEEDLFQRIKDKANNENIFHIEGLYGQDKINALFAMDAVVMPSVHEPFGIVALEALISRNILLTSRVDGLSDFLDEANSIKIEEVKPYDILTAINKVRTMKEEDKNKMLENGVKTALQYEWGNKVRDVYGVYQTVLDQKPIQNIVSPL